MKLQFTDYNGPTGAYVATGHHILAMSSAAGQIALAGGAIQAGIGNQHTADELQNEIDALVETALAEQP